MKDCYRMKKESKEIIKSNLDKLFTEREKEELKQIAQELCSLIDSSLKSEKRD